ncbi:MAG: BolA/IbaG family iron-sulfur metabolism protein, partial [Halocynthiibacter sp.]
MAIQVQEIEDLIRAAFPAAAITVTDLAGDGRHYSAEVVDESFRNQNRVQQQRAVYAALKSKMDGPSG